MKGRVYMCGGGGLKVEYEGLGLVSFVCVKESSC